MDQIKKHSSKLVIAGGGAALFFLGILLSKVKQNFQTSEPQIDKSRRVSEYVQEKKFNKFEYNSLNQNETYGRSPSKEESVQQLKHLSSRNEFSLDDILELYDKAILLMKNDYLQLTNVNRRKRRNFHLEDPKYFDLIFEYIFDIENLMKQYVMELLGSLQINKQNFENSLENILNQNNQNEAILLLTREKIKEFLPIKINLPVEKVKEIFKFQLNLLNSKSYLFEPLLKKEINKFLYNQQQLIISAITIILFDYVFEEFKIEQEDLMNLQDQTDNDLVNIFQDIQNAMNKLVSQKFSGQ